jgi:hypothetical protein
MKHHLSLLSLVLTVAFSPLPAMATHPEAYLRYELSEASTYTVGCYDPCDCAISLPMPVKGFFELRPLESNPLMQTFEVSSVRWTVPRGTESFEVLGCGTYTVGGEFAVTQRLELDLLVEGSVMHFDSGLGIGGGTHEEALDLTVSMNGMVCFDRVFELHAKRAPADHMDFVCRLEEREAVAQWINERAETIVRIDVSRDGKVIASLDPSAVEYREEALPGTRVYSAVGVVAAVAAGLPGENLFLGSCCLGVSAGPRFLRGDCDGDGTVTGQVTDAVFLLLYNFQGGSAPKCLMACDVNGDGEVTGQVTDAVYLLSFNFLGGPAPPAPFPECGEGQASGLGCERPPDCAGH